MTTSPLTDPLDKTAFDAEPEPEFWRAMLAHNRDRIVADVRSSLDWSEPTIRTEPAEVEYDDDRPGMMRVHIAQERAQALCDKYTVKELRLLARGKSISPKLRKYDLAVQLAFAGVRA